MKFNLIVLYLCLIVFMVGCTKSTSTTDQETMPQDISTGFDWSFRSGETIKVMLNDHPYTEAILDDLNDFESLTGIKVDVSLSKEEFYFDKVTNALGNENSDMDVFMTGAYQLWDYSALGYAENLTPYLNNPSLTNEAYNFEDIFPNLVEALQSTDGSYEQLALPLGFEIYSLAYNKRIFEEMDIQPPTTLDELLVLAGQLSEFDGPGSYGVAIRGTDSWATIHPSYMSVYTSFGAKDMDLVDGRLISQLASPESLEMNRLWVQLIKDGASPNWGEMPWYQCAEDLGMGKAAMFLDADAVSLYVNNNVDYPEAGNIAWVPIPSVVPGQSMASNLWTWALAMNQGSNQKEASWLFIQYFTGQEHLYRAATKWSNGDSPRASIWEEATYRNWLLSNEGYVETFESTLPNSGILFTPNNHFFEATTLWSQMLGRIVTDENMDSDEGFIRLKIQIDQILGEDQ